MITSQTCYGVTSIISLQRDFLAPTILLSFGYLGSSSHYIIPVVIAGLNRSLRTPAMIDSGATALFINRRFVEKHKIFKHPLAHPIGVNNIDGTANKAGRMTHFARLKLTVGQRTELTEFLITDLGPEDIILGLPWLKKVNPDID